MKRRGFSSLQAWVRSEEAEHPGEYVMGADERRAELTRLHVRYEKDKTRCPKCGDKAIEGGHCKKCGYVWVGIYRPEYPKPVPPPMTEIEKKFSRVKGDFGPGTCYCGVVFIKNAINQTWCPGCQTALSRSTRQRVAKREGVTAGAIKPRIRG
jgi:uncharacterized protein with PIN domain